MTEDEIERAAHDIEMRAQLHLMLTQVSEQLARVMPQWLVDMNNAHMDETSRLTEAGHLVASSAFAMCDPVFDDDGNIVCNRHEVLYPCRALREAHDGTGIWDEYVKGLPDGWEDLEDEWDPVFGDCDGCGKAVRSSDAWVGIPGEGSFHSDCSPRGRAA